MSYGSEIVLTNFYLALLKLTGLKKQPVMFKRVDQNCRLVEIAGLDVGWSQVIIYNVFIFVSRKFCLGGSLNFCPANFIHHIVK